MRALFIISLLMAHVAMSAEKSPQVVALLAKMAEAQGGDAKMAKVKTIRMVVAGEIPGAGLKMLITTQAGLDRVRVDTEIPGAMSASQGYDGKTAWSQDLLFGTRELTGAEKTALVSSTLKAARQPELVYDTVRLGEDAQFEKRPCHRLIFANKGEKGMTLFVDKESHRSLGMQMLQVSPQGEINSKAIYRDFKWSASGILYPTTILIAAGPMQVHGKVTSYEENVVLADEVFRKPTTKTGP